MPVQRKSPRLLDRVIDLLAAAQQDLPKADVQIRQIGLNLIRTFAALLFYVSHADPPDLHFPEFADTERSCSRGEVVAAA